MAQWYGAGLLINLLKKKIQSQRSKQPVSERICRFDRNFLKRSFIKKFRKSCSRRMEEIIIEERVSKKKIKEERKKR